MTADVARLLSDWDAEIRKRVDELQAGQVQPIPWAEARRMLAEEVDEPGEARA